MTLAIDGPRVSSVEPSREVVARSRCLLPARRAGRPNPPGTAGWSDGWTLLQAGQEQAEGHGDQHAGLQHAAPPPGPAATAGPTGRGRSGPGRPGRRATGATGSRYWKPLIGVSVKNTMGATTQRAPAAPRASRGAGGPATRPRTAQRERPPGRSQRNRRQVEVERVVRPAEQLPGQVVAAALRGSRRARWPGERPARPAAMAASDQATSEARTFTTWVSMKNSRRRRRGRRRSPW